MNNDATADWRVRRACREDLDALVAFRAKLQDHIEAGTPALWRPGADWRARKRAAYLDCLDDAGQRLLITEDRAGDAVGMSLGSVVSQTGYVPTHSGRIDDVWVEPPWRGRGIGRALVSELLQFFRAQGIEDLSLEWAAGNPKAEAFWRALGFEPVLVTANARLASLARGLIIDTSSDA